MFPDRSFDVLQLDHPIFRAFHKYTSVNIRTFPMGDEDRHGGAAGTARHEPRLPHRHRSFAV